MTKQLSKTMLRTSQYREAQNLQSGRPKTPEHGEDQLQLQGQHSETVTAKHIEKNLSLIRSSQAMMRHT